MITDLPTKSIKRYHGDKHFSEFLPARWRQKSTGVDMGQNYVSVTLCILTCAQKLTLGHHLIITKSRYREQNLRRYNWHIAGSLGWPYTAKILGLIYVSNKIYGSNFIKQHSETVIVWNCQNADCSSRKKFHCVIYDNFRHTFVPRSFTGRFARKL